jgi:signal transduction histidine kinase
VTILMSHMAQASTSEERSRWWFTLVAVLITVVTGLTDLLQKFEIPVPPLGHLGSVVGPSFLVFGVFKHRDFFDVLTRTRRKLDSMNEIAVGIAHEIRNPLTAIKGAVRLQELETRDGNWEEAQRYQGVIIDEINRLDGVLAGFMDFTKPLKLEKRRVPIGDLLRRTVEVASLEPGMLPISLTETGHAPECEVDPSLMRQVFINVMRNSFDACGPDGQLNIAIQWTPPRVRIVFTDNGPGFNVQELGRVMEPFFTTKKSGMGIGLAMCRRIVSAHGGKFEIGNDLEGGAIVVVSLQPAPTTAER